MLPIIQTPAAGVDFDGSVGNGLVDFDASTVFGSMLPARAAANAIIKSVSLENLFAEEIPFDCFLLAPGVGLGSTERITIQRTTGAGFSFAGCGLEVPRDNLGVSWRLILITIGKTSLASFVVSVDMGPSTGA